MNSERSFEQPDLPENKPGFGTKKEETPKSEKKPVSYEVFKGAAERNFLREVADNFIEQIREKKLPYDAFVYLDRRARFFAHLIKERWLHLYPEETVPETFFVKIGREMGHSSLDPDQPVHYALPFENVHQRDYMTKKRPSFKQVRERKKFSKQFEKLVQSLRASFSRNDMSTFEKKRVLVIDEYLGSGATLEYAKVLFSRAFPDASAIDGAGLITRSMQDWERESQVDHMGIPWDPPASIIRPISAKRIPGSLGNFVGGINTPQPTSIEKFGSFFITPVTVEQTEENIRTIEADLTATQQKVDRIDRKKFVQKKIKTKYGRRDANLFDHPDFARLQELEKKLEEARKYHERIQRVSERYRQARLEVHDIATSNDEPQTSADHQEYEG